MTSRDTLIGVLDTFLRHACGSNGSSIKPPTKTCMHTFAQAGKVIVLAREFAEAKTKENTKQLNVVSFSREIDCPRQPVLQLAVQINLLLSKNWSQKLMPQFNGRLALERRSM